MKWTPPKTCPGCGARYSDAISQCVHCKTDVFGLWLRERVELLEALAVDVLPLARGASCDGLSQVNGAACCEWREIVRRLEAAGIEGPSA